MTWYFFSEKKTKIYKRSVVKPAKNLRKRHELVLAVLAKLAKKSGAASSKILQEAFATIRDVRKNYLTSERMYFANIASVKMEEYIVTYVINCSSVDFYNLFLHIPKLCFVLYKYTGWRVKNFREFQSFTNNMNETIWYSRDKRAQAKNSTQRKFCPFYWRK